ncbi:MAG TPA: cytochrome c biogenesis protein CcsA [Candidatus Bathyarchaeia archaeon]|nr:cytochrome c biogenesis protein CcsA [Candidatus Bathyarchaeia archaeon]
MLSWAIDVLFYTGTACFVATGMMALRHLYSRDANGLVCGPRILLSGAAMLAAALILRGIAWRMVPLTTAVDAISLFAVLTAVIMVYILRKENAPALLCFYAPPLAAACLANAAMAHDALHSAPRELRGLPLTLHVGLVFLAYALFFLASMTSAAYLFQANRLKRCQTTGLFQRLPSLEQLDRTLWRLVVYGYPMFVATLALGFVWAWLDNQLLEAKWWLSPKVILSCVMAVFYGILFHLRRQGGLRGPKLSYLMLVGFIVLLLAYFALDFMHLRDYNFWEAGA